MAEKIFWLQFLFLFCLFLYLQSALSHSTTTTTTTQFDVSASLQQTLGVLSTDPQTLKPTEIEEQQLTSPPNSSSSSFSLSLHPRSSLYKTHFDDYKSLTHSRLERDSARVKSIQLMVRLAVNGVSRSDLKPVGATTYRPEDLETPLTSGVSQGSGEYFARVGIGRPVKEFYFVTDTGSDIIWLQCSRCADCYQQSDPIFDPSGSSTYHPLTCDSAQCRELRTSGCQSGLCQYQVSYGDGSFSIGDFATESLTLGRSRSVDNLAIGCGHDNEGLFIAAAGLLGLGGGPLSLISQLKATSFSYCLVDRDSTGSSTLEFNTATPADSVTTPLLRNPRIRAYRYVDFSGFLVGGRAVQLPPSVFAFDESGSGGVIVDSGTAVTRLRAEAYNALRDAFVSQARNLPRSEGVSLFDTCYDLSAMRTATVPTLSFLFPRGKALQLRPENYLIPVDSHGKYCFAFAPVSDELSIIGNVQQQGLRVSYDLAKSLVGFSPKKC